MGIYVSADILYGISLDLRDQYPFPRKQVEEFLASKGINNPSEIPERGYYRVPDSSLNWDGYADEDLEELLHSWISVDSPLSVEYGGQDEYTYAVAGVPCGTYLSEPLWSPQTLPNLDEVEITEEQKALLKELQHVIGSEEDNPAEWMLVISRG